MGWLKNIFKSPKTVDDIFDKDNGHLTKVGKWIDHWSFTKEERAEMDQNMIEGVRKFAIDTLSENTERSKTRRELAVFVIKFYCLCLFLAGMTYKIDVEWSAVWMRISSDTGLVAMVLGVGAFFWGVHTLRTYQSGKAKGE